MQLASLATARRADLARPRRAFGRRFHPGRPTSSGWARRRHAPRCRSFPRSRSRRPSTPRTRRRCPGSSRRRRRRSNSCASRAPGTPTRPSSRRGSRCRSACRSTSRSLERTGSRACTAAANTSASTYHVAEEDGKSGVVINVREQVDRPQLSPFRRLLSDRFPGRVDVLAVGRAQARSGSTAWGRRSWPSSRSGRIFRANASSTSRSTPARPISSRRRAQCRTQPRYIFYGFGPRGRVRDPDQQRRRRFRRRRRQRRPAPHRTDLHVLQGHARPIAMSGFPSIWQTDAGGRFAARWDNLDNAFFPRSGVHADLDVFYGKRTQQIGSDAAEVSNGARPRRAVREWRDPARRRRFRQHRGARRRAIPRRSLARQPVPARRLPQPFGAAPPAACRQLHGLRPRRLLSPAHDDSAGSAATYSPAARSRRATRGSCAPLSARRHRQGRQRVHRRRHVPRPVLFRLRPRDRRRIELLPVPRAAAVMNQAANAQWLARSRARRVASVHADEGARDAAARADRARRRRVALRFRRPPLSRRGVARGGSTSSATRIRASTRRWRRSSASSST